MTRSRRRVSVDTAVEAVAITLGLAQSEWPGELWWRALCVLLKLGDGTSADAHEVRVRLMIMARCDAEERYRSWCAWRDAEPAPEFPNRFAETSLVVARQLSDAGRGELSRAIAASVEALPGLHADFGPILREFLDA